MEQMTMTKTHRLLIVDDHPIVRTGLRQMLESDPGLSVVGEAAGGPDALEQMRHHKPDLVLVDIVLESGSGLDLIKQIRAWDENVKILVVSVHDDAIYAERALAAGAHGYVNKTEAPSVILDAIRTILRGKIYLHASMQDAALQRFYHTGAAKAKSPVDTLSDRELEVLGHIGRGLTTRLIASRMMLSPKTVETYREHIKRKLNLKNVTELTHYAVVWSQQTSA